MLQNKRERSNEDNSKKKINNKKNKLKRYQKKKEERTKERSKEYFGQNKLNNIYEEESESINRNNIFIGCDVHTADNKQKKINNYIKSEPSKNILKKDDQKESNKFSQNNNNKPKKENNNNCLTIVLNVGEKKKTFDSLQTKLNKAKNIFRKFLEENDENNKFEMMKEIIDLIEVNPVYNFEFLKLNKIIGDYSTYDSTKKENNIWTYEENFNSLKNTLISYDFKKLNEGEEQVNPLKELNYFFELIISKIEKEKKLDNTNKDIELSSIKNEIEDIDIKINELFSKFAKKITYNFPLIYSSERVRIKYYQLLFAVKRDKIDKIKYNILLFKNYIKSFGVIFKNKNIEEYDFDIKLYLLIICLTDLLNTISEKKTKFILKQFTKELNPYQELTQYKYNTYVYSDFSEENIYMKYLDKDTILISNDYEKIKINVKNYNIYTLINDFSYYLNYPIKYLLLRNESFEYYFQKKKNYLEEYELFDDLKKYFLVFISSKCVITALEKSGKHQNLIDLINSGAIEEIINSKSIIFTPTYHFLFQGFTDKDLLVSILSNYPYILEPPIRITDEKIYLNFFNVLLLFSSFFTFISMLHEILIHLSNGYLYQISDGEITSKSPKESKKNKNRSNNNENEKNNDKNNDINEKEIIDFTKLEYDGGVYGEQLIFGSRVDKVSIHKIIVVFNGVDINENTDKFIDIFNDSYGNKKLNENIDKNSFLYKYLERFTIDVSLFEMNKLNGNMRRESSFGIIK